MLSKFYYRICSGKLLLILFNFNFGIGNFMLFFLTYDGNKLSVNLLAKAFCFVNRDAFYISAIYDVEVIYYKTRLIKGCKSCLNSTFLEALLSFLVSLLFNFRSSRVKLPEKKSFLKNIA